MSESGRDPLIRLPIDQEIFSEVVRAGDTVEDATVAAEVISLEQEGSIYEAGGYFVFAGYVRNAAFNAEDESVEEGAVEHIQHRLPFTLRVPVEAQQGGILNIKGRLSGFELSVVSDNWLNVRGYLEIYGLYGDAGYHFRCGGQEEGTAFFRYIEADAAIDNLAVEEPEVAEDDNASEWVAAGETDWRSAAEEEESHLKESQQAQDENQALELRGEEQLSEDRGHEEFVGEKVSEARQGHGWSEDGAQSQARVDASAKETVEPIRNELAHLDRHFVSQPKTPDAPLANRPVQNVEPEKEPVASFEFEHQLEEPEAPTGHAVEPEEGAVDVRNEAPAEETWRPRFTIASVVSTEDDDVDEAEPVLDEAADRQDVPSTTPSVTDSDLWSFVDFNGPEPRHTLRYVVVMEEETMEIVAERCGCVPSELERMNPWTQGQVKPGQALYIPSKPFSIPKVPVS